MRTDVQQRTRRSMRRTLISGTAVACLLAFGIGGWAATTELAGAVIAPGSLVVDSNVKKVQHPTGGVVGELRVRDGDHVKAGNVVVRLDDTQTRANLAIITKSLDELAARQARDEAERDGAKKVTFSAELLARMKDPEVARVVQGEQKLFEIRRSAREGQVAQLRERIAQLREQIQGLADQVGAKKREIELIGEELTGVRELWSKNLIPITRVTALERDAARIEGERGSLVSTMAQTKGKITETELQILQIEQDLRTEVGKDLAEIRAKTAELVEKKVSAEDQLKRVDIRAPQDGMVHQLAVHTVGGVITPQGEPIMLIVPEADALTVEAKIQPQDIDQVRLSQKAVLRFSAFNQRTTPELNGEVSRVSADVSQDAKTGASFYTIRIGVPEAELARLSGLRLVPGMPVESFIQTGERTVISYLTKPLQDQLMKAWREK
jgi:membrane fusion protein, type I secretion system